MVNNLQFLRSLTAGSKPDSLAQGQIAFNLVDKLLFVGDGTDNITYLDGSTFPTVEGGGFFESDLDISTALDAASAYTDQKVADLVDAAPDLLNTLNELAAAIGDDANFVTTVTSSVANVQTNLSNEVSRAQGAESSLQSALLAEAGRAAAAEAAVAADLAAENVRALAAESILTADLLTEVARAQAAEATLTADLATEAARALAAEGVLTVDLATEVARAQAAEAAVAADLVTEGAARFAGDAAVAASLAAETARAQAAEADAVSAANIAVSAEAARALSVESGLNYRLSEIENGIDLGMFGGGSSSISW